jgi:hypothetical protein
MKRADKIPDDNQSFRQVFNDMTRARLDGIDCFGGLGGGIPGCTHYFRQRYKVTDEEAHELALKLRETMTYDW